MLDSLNNVGLGIGADKDAGSEPTSQTLESTTPSELHRLSDTKCGSSFGLSMRAVLNY